MSCNCEQQYVDEQVDYINDDVYDEPIRATPLEELTMLAPLIDADVRKRAKNTDGQQPLTNSIAGILFYTFQSVASFNHSVVNVLEQDNDNNRLNRKYFADLWNDKFDEFDRFINDYIPEEIRKNKSQLNEYQYDIDLITNYVNTIKKRLNEWCNDQY